MELETIMLSEISHLQVPLIFPNMGNVKKDDMKVEGRLLLDK